MTRQRNVYPRNTVAHLWAHKGQDLARDAGGNFYFSGPTIYSYGSHFAMGHHLDNGRILWNDDTYGPTTSKHQSIAWRALTQQQRQNALHIPKLNADTARNIDKALQDGKLPNCASSLLSGIQEHIASLSGKRHGSGPFEHALFEATKRETLAKIFYAAAKRKYPLPDVPSSADIPSDKIERAEFILTFSKALIQGYYKTAIEHAKAAYAYCVDALDNPDTSIYGQGVHYATYNKSQYCMLEAQKADTLYRQLHGGKKSAVAQRIMRDVTPMVALFAQRRFESEKADGLRRLDRFTQTFYKLQRKGTARRMALDLPGNVQRAWNECKDYDVSPDSVIGLAVSRMVRIFASWEIEQQARRLRESFQSAQSYLPQWPNDAKRCYSEVLIEYRRIATNAENPRYAKYVSRGTELHQMALDSEHALKTIDAQIKAKNAEIIRAWCAGESNTKPDWHAGTYARIVGSNIETSRSATVPIAHACRLARVFDRIVSAGGKTWTDGSGPQVGHYRVNAIGADGSLIIGCHSFDATEAARLRNLLQACQECAE